MQKNRYRRKLLVVDQNAAMDDINHEQNGTY